MLRYHRCLFSLDTCVNVIGRNWSISKDRPNLEWSSALCQLWPYLFLSASAGQEGSQSWRQRGVCYVGKPWRAHLGILCSGPDSMPSALFKLSFHMPPGSGQSHVVGPLRVWQLSLWSGLTDSLLWFSHTNQSSPTFRKEDDQMSLKLWTEFFQV